VGDPRDPQTQIGPLINAAAMERVTGLVKDAVDKGATTLSGGQADGACYPPTVITGVTPDMRVYGEESFGPLVSVIEVDGVDEAVSAANDTEYGLSAAVWSENVPAALELAQRIESGICHINDTTVQDEPQMPFGGSRRRVGAASAAARRWRSSPSCAGSRSRSCPGSTRSDSDPTHQRAGPPRQAAAWDRRRATRSAWWARFWANIAVSARRRRPSASAASTG
jgi:Aldehyde dehydrogenase family